MRGAAHRRYRLDVWKSHMWLSVQKILAFRMPLFVLGFLGVGCVDPGFRPPMEENTPVYWELRTNYQAVQLSLIEPFDTVQLTAVPYGASGLPLPTEFVNTAGVSMTWTSKDSSRVRVSPTGFLTARGETQRVDVEVRATIGRVTHVDTIVVRVTNDRNPPVLNVFSIHPSDSLKRAALNFFPYTFPVTALDTAGQSMIGFPIRWRSSDPTVAKFSDVSNGWLDVLAPGRKVLLFANTWVYGVVKQDSFTLETGWQVSLPITATYMRQTRMSNGQVRLMPVIGIVDIGPGGSVMFVNNTGFGPSNASGIPALPGVAIDIIFDDPTVARLFGSVVEGGNIMGLPSDTTLSQVARRQDRWFVVPGEHFFTIQPSGVRGSVIVHDK